jgi:quinohemoprotein amine dehydrogenase
MSIATVTPLCYKHGTAVKWALIAGLGVLALVAALKAHTDPLGAGSLDPAFDRQTPAPAQQPTAESDEGIPITSEIVKQECGTCHASDSKGRLSRISFRRTTPEGWQETIRRMVTLNKASIDPANARVIVKYLSDHLGLAPEEARPGAFEVERRLIDYKYSSNADTEDVCSSCHSMGRIILQRRTEKDWDLLVAMHRGWYPLVDGQAFRRFGPPGRQPGPDGRPPDNRHPMDKALAHLKSAFPLTTPEWSAWSATMRSPRLDGMWALGGYEPGEGPVFGRVVVKAGAAPDEFTTDVRYTYAQSGRTVTRAGRVLIYTGYQWRGRTTVGGDDATSLREVMFVERDWQRIAGRWFTGGYDELGLDVTLTRIGREPVVTGLNRASLGRPSTGQQVRIYGENLPAPLAPADVDFGRGVTVTRVVNSTPSSATLDVDVTADAPIGARDLVAAGIVSRSAIAVYDKVDYIKVSPAWNMARVGGVVFPKMLARFEAIGWSRGPDGKPDTKDDINLGRVDATWTIEEYTATFDDDDVKFVGEIDPSRGVFTPALDGPNPQRSGNRNNVGDVWVVATHKPTDAPPLRARAHLVVTVPLYMRWDFFTVNER